MTQYFALKTLEYQIPLTVHIIYTVDLNSFSCGRSAEATNRKLRQAARQVQQRSQFLLQQLVRHVWTDETPPEQDRYRPPLKSICCNPHNFLGTCAGEQHLHRRWSATSQPDALHPHLPHRIPTERKQDSSSHLQT